MGYHRCASPRGRRCLRATDRVPRRTLGDAVRCSATGDLALPPRHSPRAPGSWSARDLCTRYSPTPPVEYPYLTQAEGPRDQPIAARRVTGDPPRAGPIPADTEHDSGLGSWTKLQHQTLTHAFKPSAPSMSRNPSKCGWRMLPSLVRSIPETRQARPMCPCPPPYGAVRNSRVY